MIGKSCDIDKAAIENAVKEIQGLSDRYKINIIQNDIT